MNINLFYISNNKSNSDHEKKLLTRLRSPIKVSLTRIPVKKKFKSKLEQIEHEAKLLRAKIDFSKPFFVLIEEEENFLPMNFLNFL